MSIHSLSRRALLQKSAILSFAAMAAPSLAFAATPEAQKDVEVLNAGLGLVQQLIGAYQIGVDSGLLKQPGLNLALLFQSHQKAQRDAMIALIQKLGGTPVTAQVSGDYAKTLKAENLKSQNDILELALTLELAAANAFIGLIPTLQDHDATKLCGRIVADDAMHWTALLSMLGHPLPANGLTFGA